MSQHRQEIERKVVRHLIRTMKKKGWIISRINDGGDRDEDILNPNETEAMDTVFSVDESRIIFKKETRPGEPGSAILRTAYIILGNDGYDCIADHSCSNAKLEEDDFESIMNEIQEWADNFDDRIAQ